MRFEPELYEIAEVGKPVSEMSVDELQQNLCHFLDIIGKSEMFAPACTQKYVAKR